MDDYNSIESTNDTNISPARSAKRDEILEKYFESRYSGDIFKFLTIMEQTKNNFGTSYMKAIGKLIGLNYGKEVIKALSAKLTIPFRDLKYIFRLPSKMNSWKDLKINKQMDKNMKEKVRALNELHKGRSLKVIKGLRALRQGKELPKGLSKQDIRNLTIIMLSKYKKGQ